MGALRDHRPDARWFQGLDLDLDERLYFLWPVVIVFWELA